MSDFDNDDDTHELGNVAGNQVAGIGGQGEKQCTIASDVQCSDIPSGLEAKGQGNEI